MKRGWEYGAQEAPKPRVSLLERMGLKRDPATELATAVLRARQKAPAPGLELKASTAPYAKLRALPRRELRAVRKRQRLARQATQARARAAKR